MGKDLGISADSEAVKATTMTTTSRTASIRTAPVREDAESNISSLQDAATSRWLTKTLAAPRADLAARPDADALARIRLRIFGQPAARKATRAA